VPALARGDAERLLRFVAEAESFGGEHPFAGEFLTQLGRLVPADWVGYSEGVGCASDEPSVNLVRSGDEQVFSDVDCSVTGPFVARESPIFRRIRQGSFAALKFSDFLTRRDLHRTQTYNLAMKPYGLEDSLGVRLRMPSQRRPKMLLLDRGREFRARDRAVLDLLNPHLVQLYRARESRRRLGEALALHESTGAAVVLLEANERVAFATTAARELFHRYFGETRARLPEPVTSWLRERRRVVAGEPLRISHGEGLLVIELVDSALLLEERRRLPGLTHREREILDLVAEGKTNAEIAQRLWVAPGTVRKHLDNIYAKLGVHTRTAAALFRTGGSLGESAFRRHRP
jgi:DNA-binding CsgD family transcriptional regulator